MTEASEQSKSFEKAELILSYGLSSTDFQQLYRFGVKTDKVQVGRCESTASVYFFRGAEPTAFKARNLITEILESSQVLPREAETTIDLLYGNNEVEISPSTRKEKIEMLNRQIDFLKFLKEGDLFSAVRINDDIGNLGERKYLSWKWFENYPSGSIGVSPHNMALIRVEKAVTKELENETETLKKEGETFEEQRKRIFKTLEGKPKSEVFKQEIRYKDSLVRKEDGYEAFEIFEVPKPVADWLPQIWNDEMFPDGKMVRQRSEEEIKRDKGNLKRISGFIREWPSSYSAEEKIGNNKIGIGDEAIEQFVEKGRKGILYGIKISGRCGSEFPHYDVARINFDEVKKRLQQKIEKNMTELRKKQEQFKGI
jgi:hypothetical protein